MVDIVAQGFDAGMQAAGNVPRDMIAVDCAPGLRWMAVAAPVIFRAFLSTTGRRIWANMRASARACPAEPGALVEILVEWSVPEAPLQLYFPGSRQVPAAMGLRFHATPDVRARPATGNAGGPSHHRGPYTAGFNAPSASLVSAQAGSWRDGPKSRWRFPNARSTGARN